MDHDVVKNQTFTHYHNDGNGTHDMNNSKNNDITNYDNDIKHSCSTYHVNIISASL